VEYEESLGGLTYLHQLWLRHLFFLLRTVIEALIFLLGSLVIRQHLVNVMFSYKGRDFLFVG